MRAPGPPGPHPSSSCSSATACSSGSGAGGFGVVWRAHDELLHREVAVKRILLGAGGDRSTGERAEREALAAARLAHPAIVALYEACAVEDAFYLISELVDGETLARLIAEDALEDEQLLEIGVALAGALDPRSRPRRDPPRHQAPERAHPPPRARRTTAEGRIAAAKLTDFGGAQPARRGRADAHRRRARHARLHGARAERGPRGRRAQADLYSLALVLYEALSGVNPCAAPRRPRRRGGSARPLAPLRASAPGPAARARPRDRSRPRARPRAATAATLERAPRRARARRCETPAG